MQIVEVATGCVGSFGQVKPFIPASGNTQTQAFGCLRHNLPETGCSPPGNCSRYNGAFEQREVFKVFRNTVTLNNRLNDGKDGRSAAFKCGQMLNVRCLTIQGAQPALGYRRQILGNALTAKMDFRSWLGKCRHTPRQSRRSCQQE